MSKSTDVPLSNPIDVSSPRTSDLRHSVSVTIPPLVRKSSLTDVTRADDKSADISDRAAQVGDHLSAQHRETFLNDVMQISSMARIIKVQRIFTFPHISRPFMNNYGFREHPTLFLITGFQFQFHFGTQMSSKLCVRTTLCL